MDELSKFDTALLWAIGIEDVHGLYPPVIEDMSLRSETGLLFIKFMSSEGKRDSEQGRAFKTFLERANISYEPGSQERTFLRVDQKALEVALGRNLLQS